MKKGGNCMIERMESPLDFFAIIFSLFFTVACSVRESWP